MSFLSHNPNIPRKEISINVEQEKAVLIPSSQNTDHSKQQLEDLLTCHICFCHANNPMMCPFCSKLYCEGCIRRCIQIKPQCPHCRKNIKGVSMMASCGRFVNQLVEIVNGLIEKKVQEQICQEHNIPLNYYCQDCKMPVCCECQMFGKHKQHSLTQINKIYQVMYDELREQLTQFKNKLREKEITAKSIESHLIELRKIKDKQLTQIEEYTETYRNKISQNNLKQAQLIEQSLFRYQQMMNQVIKTQELLQQKINEARQNGSYLIDEGIQDKIKLLEDKKVQIQGYKCKNLLSEVIPDYVERKFVITNFSYKNKERSIIFSPVQHIEGCQWRLKIYPNGNQNVQNVYLSIFIEMVSSLEKRVTYQYQIQIVNKKNINQRMIRQYSSTFQAGQSWGYNKYIKLDNLYRQGYVDADDELQIHYYLRSPFYYNIYKQKQLYIQSLDDKILKQEDKIKDLQRLISQKKFTTEGNDINI